MFCICKKSELHRIELSSKYDVRFIVVDDSGQVDSEIESLRGIDDLSIISPPFNLGHQRAIVYGLRYLCEEIRDEDIVLTMDSDGEDRPEDVQAIVGKVIQASEKSLIVLARRTKRKESKLFKVMYFFYKAFFKLLTGNIIQSGNYASFSGKSMKKFIDHPYFDLVYSSSLLAVKIPKEFHACPRGVRYFGKSKMNFNSLIMHGVRMLMPFLDVISIRSFIVFSGLTVIGILLSAVVLYVRLMTDHAIPGWATYTILASMIISATGFGHFIVLFSLFSQSQGKALSFLNKQKIKKESPVREYTKAS